MKKGISPVVSVVLLIAVAVVAAAGVWFWVSPMITESQTSNTVGKYQVMITNCRTTTGGGNVSVRNVGTAKTPSTSTIVPIYSDSTDEQVGNISLNSLDAGSYTAAVQFNEDNIEAALSTGSYYIEDSTFAKTSFSC